MKRVLIAYERSGVLRRAFGRIPGICACSCDLEPAEDAETKYHYQADALEVIHSRKWDLIIAHPPCPLLCVSGVHWLKRQPGRVKRMRAAAREFRAIFEAVPHSIPLCVENPIMHGAARRIIGEPAGVVRQTVQPHQFGDDASKATVLWLRALPLLTPTLSVPPRWVCPQGKHAAEYWPVRTLAPTRREVMRCSYCGTRMLPRWANQTDSGQNRLSPSPTRSMDRARTYPGIAQAMAEQWGRMIVSQ